MAIDWDHLTRAQFDRIVETLIRRLYNDPDADVFVYDGRGGDGGRDIVVRIGERVLLFQLKYFRDGFSAERRSRRRQIRQSFETAVAAHKPTAWFLVIPTNPTPGEEEFVNGLAAAVPELKVKIRGRSFLDERLAAHPDLLGYFERDWLRDAARDFGHEQSILLGGLQDLTERHRKLDAIAETLDPYWRVDTATHAGVVEHRLRAKHPRAHELSPITITVTAQFGPEHAALKAAIRRSLGFGTSESVTLPPETVRSLTLSGPAWLSAPTDGVEVTWMPTGSPPNAPKTVELDVVGPGGIVLSSHEGIVRRAGSGPLGYSIEASFNDGVTLTALVGRDGASQLDGKFEFAGIAPALARANLRLYRDLHDSHALNVRLDSTPAGQFTRTSARGFDESELADLDARELLIDDLEIVQQHCRSFFPVPAELSAEDRIDIRLARLLIEGHCVISRTAQKWTATLNGSHSDEFDQMLSNDEPQAFRIICALVFEVLGRHLRLGEASFFHTQVEILDRADILAALRRGQGAGRRMVFAPIGGQHWRVFLPATWTGSDDQPLIPTPWGLHGLDGPPNG